MNETVSHAAEFLYREALLLDTRRWDEWLALYAEDCEFWVPSWRDEDNITQDPKRELCLIYYPSRSGLEERVWRARSGKSVASVVLPRTSHTINNVMLQPGADADRLQVSSSWTVHQYLPREKAVEIFFGRYEHTLVGRHGHWRIARKKVILLNDYLPARIDFYNL